MPVDPRVAEVAAAVVTALVPYLTEGGKAAARKAGEALFEALKRRFSGRTIAEAALEEFEADPADEENRQTLEAQIRKALKQDADFLAELTELLKAARPQVTATGRGVGVGGGMAHSAAVTGDRSSAAVADRGGIAAARDVNINIADPNQLWQAIRRRPPEAELRRATDRYLRAIVARYRYLDFKGMGISDRVPLRLPLLDMYVPLKARLLMPQGETWTRRVRLAGRKPSAEEVEVLGERMGEPRPVLDILRRNDGLIILGDPGSGKTTFLKYLALKLASGDDLGLGARLPLLVPLSAYANELAKRDVRLDDFIVRYLHDLGADEPLDAMLEAALKEGGALILLDGLDEVRETGLRQTVAERVAHFYTFHRQAGNRFVMTSRIVGYREVRPTAEGLAECTLVDFEDEEIEAFVTRWTVALEREARGETAVADWEAKREREELLAAMARNPGVRELAANPLLLTILALMKRQGVTLPERRVELYDQYVRTLLSSWNRARGLGRPPTRDLDVVETVRVLAPLALWMHTVSPGVGLVKRGDLQRELERIYRERGEEDPERAALRFLADVREYAGLLLERGAGQYGFIHLTFEEYLAAVGIARQGQRDITPIVDTLAAHVDEPAWREVSLLTIGYLGIVQQWDEVAGDVLLALLEREPGEPGRVVVLAGEAVVDSWPGGVTPACRERVVQALLRTMRDWERVKPALRAAAGRALARLGDPRFDPDRWSLPKEPLLGFVRIPAGEFLMGSTDEDEMAADDEKPQHQRSLPLYYIARYPVTQAQYRAFVEDPQGYRDRRWWTQAGLVWRGERTRPRVYGEPFNLANHPVVGITWYEAVAYARWLTERLREEAARRLEARGEDEVARAFWQGLKEGRLVVTLPSEAEWEKAARGVDGRRYPWGDDPDPNRANYGDTGLGTTSAVGCFPGGASPYGVEEMSGNVWEWCRTKWEGSYENYRGDDDLEGKDRRVVRGGSFDYNQWGVRCAYRDGYYPSNYWYINGFRLAVVPR